MCSILGIFPEDHHTTEMFFDTDDCEAKSMESNYERVKQSSRASTERVRTSATRSRSPAIPLEMACTKTTRKPPEVG